MKTKTYPITGMSCKGCKNHVEQALGAVDGVKKAVVDLQAATATIESEKEIPFKNLEAALQSGHYRILKNSPSAVSEQPAVTSDHESMLKTASHQNTHAHHHPVMDGTGHDHTAASGHGRTYYCPMHCEGDKTYDKPGSCPVCGMDLVEQPVKKQAVQYTCPMHPEIIRDEPGACPICGMDLVPMAADEEDATYKILLRKFKIAVAFTLPIFIIAMSEMIPGNPLFKIMDLKYWNLVEFILSIPVVFYATWMFFERAWRSIITWRLNMFTLIGIGSGIAWLFSVIAILIPGVFPDEFKTHHGTVYVYFEAATVILTLALLGQLLEARAHGKTNSAIRALLDLSPSTATKVMGNEEVTVSVDEILAGDLLRVKPGGKIPVDGSVQTGETYVDESMITGEPIPVDKKPGDPVKAGTINGNKSFVMTAEKVGAETLLSQIIDMVNTASRSRAPVQNLADKISGYFIPVVVLTAVVTFIVWSLFGPVPPHVYGLINAIAVLIIACPCALGLATPMSVMVGVGKGAQSGVLIKNAEALEKMNDIDIVVVDKTGTITEGKPTVEKIISLDSRFNEKDLLQKMISLNSHSEHPLAQATLRYGEYHHVTPKAVTDFEAVAGKGVTAVLGSKKMALGNLSMMDQLKAAVPAIATEQAKSAQDQGKTVSYLSEDHQVIGLVIVSDKLKATSKEAVRQLQKEGVKVWMFTGDNERAARSVSKMLQLDGYKAGMLPEDKLAEIKRLQATGQKVAMAGDGINDAPGLSQADVGIAMGTGTGVAIESAQITLVKGDLKDIAKARLLSEKVMKNIRQNLWFALGYNIIGIPVAAGVLYPFTGLLLSPMIAALAMSFSSVSVIANSLRLRKASLNV